MTKYAQISRNQYVRSSVLLEMLEWKLVREKVSIDRCNMNAYTQVRTLTAIFRICHFLLITGTSLRKHKLSGV